jgi:NADH dehydrogenase
VIAIVGATGVLGDRIARALLSEGRPVIAVTRDPAKATELARFGAEVRQANLTERASLAGACRGAESVVSTVHAILGRGQNRSELVDDEGQRALIDAAKSEGVGHFVMMSAIGVSADHPIDFWRSKHRAEQHLKASGMSYTIIRPTMFMETHAHLLLGRSILEKGSATIFGSGEQKVNFVAAGDVARLVIRVLGDARARDTTIEIGGPENLSRNEVAALYGRLAGREPKLRHLPLGVLRALSAVMRPLHPGVSRVMQSGVVMSELDETFDPSGTLKKYPMTLTKLEEFVRARVEEHRREQAGRRSS